MKAQLGIGGLLGLTCLGLSVTGLGLPEAIALAQTAEGQREKAIRLNQAGEELRLQGKWQDALETFGQALGIFRRVGDRSGQATSLQAIGDVYAGLKESEKALDFYQQALVIRRELGDREEEGTLLMHLSLTYFGQRDFDNSLSHAQQALTVFKEIDNWSWIISSLRIIGNSFQAQQQYSQAIEVYRQSLSLQEQVLTRIPEDAKNIYDTIFNTYDDLVDALRESGRYEEAIAIMPKMREAAKASEEKENESIALFSEFMIYASWVEELNQPEYFDEYLLKAKNALTISQALRESNINSGQNYSKDFQVVVDLAEMVLFQGIANIYEFRGEYVKGLDFLNKQLESYHAKTSDFYKAFVLIRIASIYENQGNYTKSLSVYEQALLIDSEEPKEIILNNIAKIWSVQGQYDNALSVFQEILASSQKTYNQLAKGPTPENLRLLHCDLGIDTPPEIFDCGEEFQAFLKPTKGSIDAIQRMSNSVHGAIGSILNNIGSIYGAQGEQAKSESFYRQALAIHNEYQDREGQATVYVNLGVLYSEQGDYATALQYVQQAEELFKTVGDQQQIIQSAGQTAGVYLKLGQFQRALDKYEQALSLARKLKAQGLEAELMTVIAKVYIAQGKTTDALTYYQQALTITQTNGALSREGNILSGIGQVYLAQSQPEKALDFFQQALAVDQKLSAKRDIAYTQSFIGQAQTQLNQTADAQTTLQQSLALAQEVGDRPTQAQTLAHLGALQIQQQQPELAIVFYKQAINTYENIRGNLTRLEREIQESYTNSISDTYRTLADLLLQQDRILEAQQVLDLLKVQELEDYLKNTRGTTNDPLIILKPEQEILDRYNELQKTAIQIGQELTQLRHLKTQQPLSPQQENRLAQLVALEKDLNHQFNTFIDSDPIQTLLNQVSRKTSRQIVPLEDLNNLRDNLRNTKAVLISPLILPDRLELIITTPNSPPLRRTVNNFDAQKLRETVTQYRSALQSPNNIKETKRLAQQLYTWLLKPLEADLEAANPDTLIYAPDGILRYIPLAALYDGNQWIAERYRTNNIVAQSLTELDTAPQTAPRILAGAWGNQSRSIQVGNQDFRFGGIPFTLNEVDSLAQLFPTKVLREQTFDRKNLMPELNNFSIIHLATHGKFVVGDANNSFLALGSGETIPLPEIKDLTMTDVELVVLSACETGIGGSFGEGEEILGLGYQFQRAGAKAALASLWQVDDGGTQLLMDAFYAALQKGMTKAQALQEAQKALISSNYTTVGLKRAGIEVVSTKTGSAMTDEQLSNPYYWAPFILIGNGL